MHTSGYEDQDKRQYNHGSNCIHYGCCHGSCHNARGKALADVTHTIIVLAQITPVWVLNSLHETLGTMLRIEALKELRDTLAAKLGKEETSEEDE